MKRAPPSRPTRDRPDARPAAGPPTDRRPHQACAPAAQLEWPAHPPRTSPSPARRLAGPRRWTRAAGARAHAYTGTSGSDRSTCTPDQPGQRRFDTAASHSPDTVPRPHARNCRSPTTSSYAPGPGLPWRTQDPAPTPAPDPRPKPPHHSLDVRRFPSPGSMPPTTDTALVARLVTGIADIRSRFSETRSPRERVFRVRSGAC